MLNNMVIIIIIMIMFVMIMMTVIIMIMIVLVMIKNVSLATFWNIPTLLNNMAIMMMMIMIIIIIMMMMTRFKNGSVVKNSSEYMIKHTANLPDYTTNTLSYVQVGFIITKRRYDT